jgi:predicted P-loop ATPase
VAERNAFDTAIAWLEAKQWDGEPRVEQFFTKYFGAADSPYVRAVSRYAWTALAGRVLVPGEKADMVPVLIGNQGSIKSSALAAMVERAHFVEVSFTERADDLARKMRGKLVIEISELHGLHTRELEGIKAWVTKTHETWIPKYMEFATDYGRRSICFGTTNEPEFLADITGNRRWAPIVISRADKDAISRDRDQLWAEAACMYAVLGVDYHLAERLAVEVHEAHTITEPWAEFIEDWLDTEDTIAGGTPRTREFLRVGEVAKEALQLDSSRMSKAFEQRIGKALRECGYERIQKKVDGKKRWVWVARG